MGKNTTNLNGLAGFLTHQQYVNMLKGLARCSHEKPDNPRWMFAPIHWGPRKGNNSTQGQPASRASVVSQWVALSMLAEVLIEGNFKGQ